MISADDWPDDLTGLDISAISPALRDVAAERRRQIEEEGWTAAHDDTHTDGSLAEAAACYASTVMARQIAREGNQHIKVPMLWPPSWSAWWWKPKDRRRDLVRAGALILAEIERLDRLDREIAAMPTEGNAS